MEKPVAKNLLKLYESMKKGSNGFRPDAVKPHLEILKYYASQCEIVTEFGVETACSTLAFMVSGCKKIYGYDIVITDNARLVKQAAQDDGIFFRLTQKDDLKVKIKKTDLLYIDTDHWYGQIKAELERHHKRVSKWILMHSTETFGLVNPFDGRPGMKGAIFEFIDEHPEWQIKEQIESGHGLTILERQAPAKKKFFGIFRS